MKRLALASTFLVALMFVPNVATAQYEGMKYRIPLDANTLVLINADKMFGSRVADKERWQAKRQAAYDSGILALPPDATEVIIAGRSDHEYGKTIWELAMVKLQADRSVTTVAQRYGGQMDDIVGRSAARLPNDHYIVQIMGNLLAAYTPANRQVVSRWLRTTDVGSKQDLPPYMEQAFGYAKNVGTPIVMAMDLEGAISEAEIKKKFDSLESLKGTGVTADQLAAVMNGIKGVTLGVTLQDDAIGAIRVDFAGSPAPLAKVGKNLLIEILQRQGGMVDDFFDWRPEIKENPNGGGTFLLRGKLSESGTRRILSILELPRTLAESMEAAMSPGANPEGQLKLLATQQYWKTVTQLLDDLRLKPKRDHVKTFGQAAIWYDKYARKIDRLPILNVDPEMLDYGTQMAASLRDAEMAMKSVGMRTSLRTASNNPVSGGYSSGWGGYRAGMGYHGGLYGSSGYSATVTAANATRSAKGNSDAVIRGQERTQGAATVQNIWLGIDETTSKMRRTMVEKYSADF